MTPNPIHELCFLNAHTYVRVNEIAICSPLFTAKNAMNKNQIFWTHINEL